jgi:hypothetical protein
VSATEEQVGEPQPAEEAPMEEQPQPEEPTPEEPAEESVHPNEEQQAPMTEAQVEDGIRLLEKEASRHANRVSAIMGEDAQLLEPCELCAPAIPGFRWPGELPEEQRQAVLAAIGLGTDADYAEDPEAEACSLCKGHGETLTGSQVPEQRTRPCPMCGAKGWTTQAERNTWESTQQAKQAATELGHLPAAEVPAGVSLPSMDAWSRPLGHEFYGRNPIYMTEAERARDVSGAG